MAKRFTDSGKFRDNWYRKLTPNQKCLWEFIISECSLAGIIDIDFDSLEFHIGAKITIEDFEPLNERIYTLPDGKVFIPKFIIFQQKELNENNPAHKNIIEILSKYGIDLSLNLENLERGFKGASKVLQSTIGNVKVGVTGNIISKGNTTKKCIFQRPTKTEIIDYINERQLKVDSESFYDHYESNGWKVGKVPMKDWKATLRNWDRKSKEVKKPFKNEFLDKLEQERAI